MPCICRGNDRTQVGGARSLPRDSREAEIATGLLGARPSTGGLCHACGMFRCTTVAETFEWPTVLLEGGSCRRSGQGCGLRSLNSAQPRLRHPGTEVPSSSCLWVALGRAGFSAHPSAVWQNHLLGRDSEAPTGCHPWHRIWRTAMRSRCCGSDTVSCPAAQRSG